MAQKRLDVLASHVGASAGKSFDVRGNIAFIHLDNPPLNALSQRVRMSIVEGIERAEALQEVQAIVITGNGKAFSAGADITEFTPEGLKKTPLLPDMIDRVEASSRIVVAAVNGMALGGGTELSLGCHYRVCSPSAFFGLPEIKLGLIPGAGGTQRLPRLVGVQSSIQMCCTGRNIKAPTAAKMGLVDYVTPHGGNFLEHVSSFVRGLLEKKAQPRRTSNDSSKLGNWLTNKLTFHAARKQIASSIPSGMVSPLAALDAVAAATTVRDFKSGMAAERDIFIKMAKTPQAAAMQHFFFSERQALKVPGLPSSVKPRPVRLVGIIGGGTMGGGIAMNFLSIGINTVILETSEERKKFCIDTIAKNYKGAVAKKRLSEERMMERMSLLRVVVNDYAAFQDCDYVIEAVFESMQLKKQIFAKLDQVCKKDCVLATNTSTLSVDEIASATRRPHKVIGAHFFSPANIMKLLEFVRGKETDPDTMVTSLAVGKLIKKAPVMVGNCFGFVSNRMILKGGFQALCMVEEGAFPHDVDAVIKKFGFPVGPFAMQDIAGLDVGSKIRLETPPHLVPKRDAATIAEELVKQGRLGQKAGKGWYIYNKDKPRVPVVDPKVTKMTIDASSQKGLKRRQITAKEIQERYLYAMINEAAYILQEGFALRPSDIDIVFIYGFGFPPYKGGPCHFADFVGLKNIVSAIDKYSLALGADTFPPPCPLLLGMARSEKTFASMNKA